MSRLHREQIELLADKLHNARKSKVQIQPPSKTYSDLSIEDAYKIQLLNIEKRIDDNNRPIGKKIGLTSKAMQESLGVNEPDYGFLLTDMEILKDNPVVEKDMIIQPRVEGELAFILKDDLQGPNVTVDDVLNATQSIVASIEVVDSRVKDWKINIKDTIADNASSAYYILGDNFLNPKDAERIEVEMTLYQNGKKVNQGSGKDVLGDPASCVAWLANKLHEYNIKLEAGDVVLSGAISAAVAANPGDQFTCEFTKGFGNVSLTFE